MQLKGLFSFSFYEKMQELSIQLIVGMYIAFIIVENPAFLILLVIFSLAFIV